MEQDFGDRFFSRDGMDSKQTFEKQYIHIPSINEVKKQIKESKFKLIEVNSDYQISKTDVREYPPVFFVCRK